MLLFSYIDTIPLSLANFVGSVFSFLNVLIIRLRSLLLAASLSFDRVRNQRARHIKLFTLPGSDAEKAVASNRNGMSCLEAAF